MYSVVMIPVVLLFAGTFGSGDLYALIVVGSHKIETIATSRHIRAAQSFLNDAVTFHACHCVVSYMYMYMKIVRFISYSVYKLTCVQSGEDL